VFEIIAVRTKPSDDQTHEHVELVGYASTHMVGETIYIPIERVFGRQAFGERFAVVVDGAPADVAPSKCPVCGHEPYIKTTADTGTEQKLLELPRT
jgi:hypothetical protein